MKKVILNTKVDPLLKEAVRLVANKRSKMNSVQTSSSVIVTALLADKEIKKQYDILKK